MDTDKKTFRCNKCGVVTPESEVLKSGDIKYHTACPKCGKLLWEVLAYSATDGASRFTSEDWMYKPKEGRPVGPDTTTAVIKLNPVSGNEAKVFLKDDASEKERRCCF